MREINEDLNDMLLHYGVKGMKWKVRRSPEQIKEDISNGVNAVGDSIEDLGDKVMGNDSISKEFGDVVDSIFGKKKFGREARQLKDAIKDKMGDVGENVKKKGVEILISIFGKAEKKSRSQTFVTYPK